MSRRTGRAWVLLAVVLLALAACNDDDDDENGALPTVPTTVNLLDFTTTSTVAPTETTAAPAATTTAAPTTTTSRPTTTTRPVTTSTTRAPTTVTVGRAQNGQTVQLVKGDKLQVVLDECAGCGDQWRVTGIPNQTVFGPVTSSHEPAGRATFEATATASGTTGIEIGYVRAGQTSPSERFALTLTVAR